MTTIGEILDRVRNGGVIGGWDEDCKVVAHADKLAEALHFMTERYTDLVNSGDAGLWDPELEEDVKRSRAILKEHGK